MRQGYEESPINPLPPAVWVLALPVIASEIVFGLGQAGMVGGQGGIGLRSRALEMTAFSPEIVLRYWQVGAVPWSSLYRFVTYPFINASFTNAAFVAVFILALGKVLAESFRPAALLGLFFGSAILSALIYTAVAGFAPMRFNPLFGGYPAVYGLVGAFTFLLWRRLRQTGGNPLRAFGLIAMLVGLQLVFVLAFGGAGTGWIAELIGFAAGFGLSFLLIPGGPSQVRDMLRQR